MAMCALQASAIWIECCFPHACSDQRSSVCDVAPLAETPRHPCAGFEPACSGGAP